MRYWGRSIAAVVNCAAAGLLAGCVTLAGGPDRIFSVADEVAIARVTVESLTAQYYAGPTEGVRNEIIARRMYIIDVEYSQYEAGLTRERQEVGFITATTSQALNTAGALFTPAQTVRVLSGLAGAVGSVRGYYDSEIVVAKTIQIAQGNMRAMRDRIANRIRAAMAQPVPAYPLSLALSDLEDYYRAGTLAAGLIKATGDAGTEALVAAAQKQNVIAVTFGPDSSSQILWAFLTGPGANTADRRRQMNAILRNPPLDATTRGRAELRDIRLLIDSGSPVAASVRAQLIEIARTTGVMPR